MSEDNNELLTDSTGEEFGSIETLEAWVQGRVDSWREDYDDRYADDHRAYYRQWRGVTDEDNVSSKRSRFRSPATAQAVEESCAEVDMSMHPVLFDIQDDYVDRQSGEAQDIMLLRNLLHEDIAAAKIQPAISESILIAAIYGSVVAEVELAASVEQKVATRPVMDGAAVQIGVEMKERVQVRLRPLLPQNVLIDPNATTVDNAMGVALDEYVGAERILEGKESGAYLEDADVGTITDNEWELSPDQDTTGVSDNRVRRVKYFGLVPRHLLEEAEALDADLEDLNVEPLGGPNVEADESYYVEAIVVLGNGILLSAVANPYLMQDRPVVSFQWDNVPSRFWGRGVVEKARSSQLALDTEIRSRIDALALTIHPMLAIDATRMPRGADTSIRPGKMLKVNGNPAEILQPFKFGDVSQMSFEQAAQLQGMVQQATGAINATGQPAQSTGGGTGAIAMQLGASMKRHKRTLTNFQTNFLIPLIQKIAHRYMQFDPETYPVGDYKFNCTGSLGLIAREYETSQLSFLLQTMGSDSPLYATVLEGIVENMNLSNREGMIAKLKEANQPDPAAGEQQKQKHEMDVRIQATTLKALDGEAAASMAKAENMRAQTQNIEAENEIQYARIAASVRTETDTEAEAKVEASAFEKKLAVLDEIRKDRELNIKEEESKVAVENMRKEKQEDEINQAAMANFMSEGGSYEETQQ